MVINLRGTVASIFLSSDLIPEAENTVPAAVLKSIRGFNRNRNNSIGANHLSLRCEWKHGTAIYGGCKSNLSQWLLVYGYCS